MTFAQDYKSDEVRNQAYSDCHTRSATRVLKSLLSNGGDDCLLVYLVKHAESILLRYFHQAWTTHVVAVRPSDIWFDIRRVKACAALFCLENGRVL